MSIDTQGPIPADRHIVVVGLGLGDEAKGATVDWLCATRRAAGRPVGAVVRFNGGAQAAHNVAVGDRHHTFHQLGSGTLAGVPTHLGPRVLVEPISLAQEAETLAGLGVADPLSMLSIDPDALVTTPIHAAANRTREDLRAGRRHGSTGLGIGETVWYDLASAAGIRAGNELWGIRALADVDEPALRVGDCRDRRLLIRRLDALARHYAPLLDDGEHDHPGVEALASMLVEFGRAVRQAGADELRRRAQDGPLVFEGAQGVLLDEWRGFHPHTTWSTTTAANAVAMLRAAGLLGAGMTDPYVLGLTRAYATRHGAGPLPTEDPSLVGRLPEPHNGAGRYQGGWRVGHLDLVALRYALEVAGAVDGLAVSHLDLVEGSGLAVADAYVLSSGQRLDRLVPGPERDLAHQERLTGLVSGALPELRPLPTRAAVVRELARLGVPIVLTADGPDRSDRTAVVGAASAPGPDHARATRTGAAQSALLRALQPGQGRQRAVEVAAVG